jgi:predicted ATP-grasp superfamily ATP-dependent carboligase
VHEAAARLRLLGTAPDDVQRLRDARGFFALLHSAGIAHPPLRFEAPQDPQRWLEKDSATCGGDGVRRRVARSHIPDTAYWQREQRGQPMSATFVANGRDAFVLGFNRQITHARGDLPYGFGGVIGPLPLPPGARETVDAALRVLVREYRLLGLGSLDFMLDGDQAHVLEVNARWPASAALYAHAQPMRLHLRACLEDDLPPALPPAAAVQGWRIVFARRPLAIDAAASDRLAARRGVHDLPRAGTLVVEGAPLCSVSAHGRNAQAVQAELERRHDLLLDELETLR